MPPAFNLSQDQTLQFDLFLTQRNRSELHFYFRERFKQVSKIAFGVTPLQAPTLIGCNLLKNFRNQRRFRLFLASLTCCRQRRIELCQRFHQLVNTFLKKFFELFSKRTCRAARRAFADLPAQATTLFNPLTTQNKT